MTSMANVYVAPNSFVQIEPSVGVNALNSNTVIVTNDINPTIPGPIQINISSNGGASFTSSFLPLPAGFGAAANSVVTYGFPNVFLINAFALNIVNNELIDGSVILYRSLDNGATFQTIMVFQGFGNRIFLDKPSNAIDNSGGSQYFGNAYVTYTRFFNDFTLQDVYFHYSIDTGAAWSGPMKMSVPNTIANGTSVAVGALGEVYMSWIDSTANPNANFIIRRSDNGGVSFAPQVNVSLFTLVPFNHLPVDNWQFQVTTNSFIDCDISSSPFRGNVYAVWQDYSLGTANIFISVSSNQGATWSVPLKVNDSAAGTQNFYPSLAVSPINGAVFIIYYTNRVNPTLMDVFLAGSYDGGVTFQPNIRVTDQSFDPNNGQVRTYIGDYITTTIKDTGVITVWTDTRTGNAQIFSQLTN